MSSEPIYYVYAYLDPVTREPFYIGKGKGGRASIHLREARNDRHTHKNYYNPIKLSRIRKILDNGMEPIIDYVCEDMEEEDAFELEEFLISEIGRKVLREGPLTNLTDGGEGFSGLIRDDTVYHLYNLITHEEFKGKRKDIMESLGVSDSGMSMLISGSIKRSSDWCLFENRESLKPECSNIPTHFIHEDGRNEYCTFRELSEKYNIKSNLTGLYNGTYMSTDGWKVDYLSSSDYWINRGDMYTLYHYSGQEVHGRIEEISQITSIIPTDVLLLVKGHKDTIDGWFSKEYLKGKLYKFVHYTGKEVIGTITHLSNEIGCSETLTCAVVNNRKTHANWWFHNEIPVSRKNEIDMKFTPRHFTHISGLKEFMCSVDLAKKHNLVIGKVNSVMKGERRHTKGWFLGEEVPKDIKGFKIAGGNPTIHSFVNLDSGEIFRGTRVEFSAYASIDQKVVYDMVTAKSVRRRWKLMD